MEANQITLGTLLPAVLYFENNREPSICAVDRLQHFSKAISETMSTVFPSLFRQRASLLRTITNPLPIHLHFHRLSLARIGLHSHDGFVGVPRKHGFSAKHAGILVRAFHLPTHLVAGLTEIGHGAAFAPADHILLIFDVFLRVALFDSSRGHLRWHTRHLHFGCDLPQSLPDAIGSQNRGRQRNQNKNCKNMFLFHNCLPPFVCDQF